MWKTPRRKAFTPSGVTVGTLVTGHGRAKPWQSVVRITGQVWSRAAYPYAGRPRGRWWWVVTADQYAYLCEESALAVLGQCDDAPALLDETAA